MVEALPGSRDHDERRLNAPGKICSVRSYNELILAEKEHGIRLIRCLSANVRLFWTYLHIQNSPIKLFSYSNATKELVRYVTWGS
jgi:hypothetical protein